MRLGLIKTGAVESLIAVTQDEGLYLLPNGDTVSPPQDGWSNDEYRFAAVIESSIPEGHELIRGGVVLVDGVPRMVLETRLPEPVIPDRLSSRQFFMQLAIDGLTQQVKAWIELQGPVVEAAFERSATFVRDDPMLQIGFMELGFDTARQDKFFIDGGQL